jgi:hypothetical protein
VSYALQSLDLAVAAPALTVAQELQPPAKLASFEDIPWPLFDQPAEGPL